MTDEKKNTHIIKSVHEFKKRFFPYTYKQELESGLTDDERVELLIRRSLRSTFGNNTKALGVARSPKVASIEDLEINEE